MCYILLATPLANNPSEVSGMSSLAVVNAGLIASGDLERPVLEGNCVLVEDGKISEIGDAARLNARDADTVIDAAGSAVMPGLIDSHFHVVIGITSPDRKWWTSSTVTSMAA